VRFTMAVPRQLQEQLANLQDLHFALVSYDEVPGYAEWYSKQRDQARQVILDNGMHENNGKPRTCAQLVEACKLFRPNYLVCPDWMGNARKTLDAFNEMRRMRPNGCGLAVVMQGKDPVERYEFFEAVRLHADMLCFPYRMPRLEWMKELVKRVPSHVKWPPKIHLLGVSNMEELGGWHRLMYEMGVPEDHVSIDTTKPIKWALHPDGPKRLDELDSFRDCPGWPQVPLKEDVTPEQLACIYYNVAYLRRAL
jgi:hypothetical protein